MSHQQTFGVGWGIIRSAGVPSTAGLAKHTLPTGAVVDASICLNMPEDQVTAFWQWDNEKDGASQH